MANHPQDRAKVNAAGTQQIEAVLKAGFQNTLMGASFANALTPQPHPSSKPPAVLYDPLVSEAVLKDVEGWDWLMKQDAFFQPILKCIGSSGILVISRGIKGLILPKFKSNHIIRALLMIEPLLPWGDYVIGRADDQ